MATRNAWTQTNSGLPMFQNNSLIVHDKLLFGSFLGDRPVWTAPVQDITTGIESPYAHRVPKTSCNDIGVNAYPNPADAYIQINAGEKEDGLTEITISEISGKTVHRTAANHTGNTTLDISKYVAGVYIVKVRDGGKVCHTKFVKQ